MEGWAEPSDGMVLFHTVLWLWSMSGSACGGSAGLASPQIPGFMGVILAWIGAEDPGKSAQAERSQLGSAIAPSSPWKESGLGHIHPQTCRP